MNILFLTSAMEGKDFNRLLINCYPRPNPSNQVFFNKMIHSLSIDNNVFVLSLRPNCTTTSTFDNKDENNIKYYYGTVYSKAKDKFLHQNKAIMTLAEKIINQNHLDSFIIVTDVLRFSLLKAAFLLSRKYNKPVIGVVSDNPSNLSNVKERYVKRINKYASRLTGYITLTDKLNETFNKMNRKHYIIEGLVEPFEVAEKKAIGNYFFFAGSLYERYGVKNLIDGFLKTNSSYSLVIAGTGPLREYVEQISKEDDRVLYLSMLTKEEIYSLESNAVANINPRPLNEKMDSESIPSKLLEYIASGKPVISTKHPKLYLPFANDVIWLEDSSKEGIAQAITEFFNRESEALKKMSATAKNKVFKLYGVRERSEEISHFLNDFRDLSNK